MAGFMPAHPGSASAVVILGGRDKPGHDEGGRDVRDLSMAALPTVMTNMIMHALGERTL
jgi:hypothetical protein